MKAELIMDAQADLGEGPCWDDRQGKLYWVDIMAGRVHRYDPQSGRDESRELGQPVGTVAVCESGRLIVALRDGFFLLDFASGELQAIADPEADRPDNRFNDGKCDPAGRFWAGTMSLVGQKRQGSLYCLDPAGSAPRRMVEDVSTSNGLAWSPDHRTMYYIDSPTRQVSAYDYDLATGTLDRPRTVVTIPEGEGVPDGMTIDEEGMLWVAQWDGWCVSRWDPQTGRRIGRVEVPAARVTSCVFGGEDRKQLYITTARTGLKEDQLASQPLAGGVFRVHSEVAGAPTYRYKD